MIYLNAGYHFWRGVEEGILPPPFSWGERWRGGERSFWRGVKKGVPSENSGGYPSLVTSLVLLKRRWTYPNWSSLIIAKMNVKSNNGGYDSLFSQPRILHHSMKDWPSVREERLRSVKFPGEWMERCLRRFIIWLPALSRLGLARSCTGICQTVLRGKNRFAIWRTGPKDCLRSYSAKRPGPQSFKILGPLPPLVASFSCLILPASSTITLELSIMVLSLKKAHDIYFRRKRLKRKYKR